MEDKCYRHKRLLSHECVKCMKYRDNFRLKQSLLNEQLKLISLIYKLIKCYVSMVEGIIHVITITNEKMKRKTNKLNSTLNNCDNNCEHFESVYES